MEGIEFSTYAAGAVQDKQAGSLQDLDTEMELLEQNIAALADRLSPVLSQYAGTEQVTSSPEAEPSSQLRARARRLSYLRRGLNEITQRIDL